MGRRTWRHDMISVVGWVGFGIEVWIWIRCQGPGITKPNQIKWKNLIVKILLPLLH